MPPGPAPLWHALCSEIRAEMFLPFVLRLVGGSVFPLFLLSLLSAPVLGVETLSTPRLDRRDGPRALAWTRLLTRTAVQLYVWLGWAAYCAVLVVRYTDHPLVHNPLPYFTTALFALNVPFAFLIIKESGVLESAAERVRLRHGSGLYRIITIVAFITFCLAPGTTNLLYGWLLNEVVPSQRRIEVSELLREASLGDADAQNQLGHLYARGGVVPLDLRESERWHLAAARQNHRDSQSQLCHTYLDGGVLGNERQAVQWCAEAADQGDPRSSFLLANLYSQGRGVSKDPDQATRLYRDAAEAGVPEAQVIIGLDYADDANLPVNLVEAYRWLTLASNHTADADFKLDDVIELRESLRTRLTVDQLAEARRMVLEWQPCATTTGC